MKKLLLVVIAFLFMNVQAGDELVRKFLKIDSIGKFEDLPVEMGSHTYQFNIKETDTYIFVHMGGNNFKSENKYFEMLTKGIYLFISNYKIGHLSKKEIWFGISSKKYSYMFSVSNNNLRLLENRDFGRKDAFSDDTKFSLYPLKTILNRGYFLDIKGKGFTSGDNMTKRYKEFLTTYDIDIIEGGLERIYRESKIK